MSRGSLLAKTCMKQAERELAKRRKKGRVTMDSFVQLIDLMRQNARHHGYALGVHGSLLRDIDLIAVPWVSRPKAPSTLKKSLQALIKVMHPHVYSNRKPDRKPQGRVAWALHLGNGTYIDLSVMSPRRP